MSTAAKVEGTPGPRVVVGRLQRAPREGRPAKRSKAATGPGPSRVALMLALAHSMQRAIDRGEIRDQSEAAQRLGITSARLSQILDLTLLCPWIQREVLAAESRASFDLTERSLREAVTRSSWAQQEEACTVLCGDGWARLRFA